MEKKMICPEFDGCKVGGCVHRAPHTERDTCKRGGEFCPWECVKAEGGGGREGQDG